MNILKNKHLVLAMFVAPILAILAYFATDYVVSEKPQVAQQGNSYKLAAMSNCRYQSGVCTLKNGEVEVNVRAERIGDSLIELTLRSGHAIQNVLVSFVGENADSVPTVMHTITPEADTWGAKLHVVNPEKSTLRLALELSGSLYYAETSAVFVDYRTTYSRDNFSD